MTIKKGNISSVKASFTRFLREVRRGHEVIILDRKEPIAKIIPYQEGEFENILVHAAAESPSRLKFLKPKKLSKKTDSLKILLEDRLRRA